MCAAKRQTARSVFPFVTLFGSEPRAVALKVHAAAGTSWSDAAFAYSEQLEMVEVWSPEGGVAVIPATYLGTPPDRDPVFAKLLQVVSRKRGVFVGYVDCLREALGQMAHLQNVLSGSNPTPSVQANRKILECVADFLWAANVSRLLRMNSACVPRPETEFGQADAVLERVNDLLLEARRKSDIPRALMARLQEQSSDLAELVPAGEFNGLAWVRFLLCFRSMTDQAAIQAASGIARDPVGMLACLRSLDVARLERELQVAREREFLDMATVAKKGGAARGGKASAKTDQLAREYGPSLNSFMREHDLTRPEACRQAADSGKYLKQDGKTPCGWQQLKNYWERYDELQQMECVDQ